MKLLASFSLALLTLLDCGRPGGAVVARDSATPPQAAAPSAASAPGAVAGAQARAAADTAGAVPLALRTVGSATAPVTVYEMSDFQCPYCRRHAVETWPALEREYVQPGKVRWVFINFPLTQIHPNAVAAAELAMCAARQNRFWPAHDLLYAHQDDWAKLADPTTYLLGLGDSLGLKRDTLLACLKDPATRDAVRQDAESAARAGATSTPTFYIEGGLLTGAYPIEIFRQVLDSIHKVKTQPGAK